VADAVEAFIRLVTEPKAEGGVFNVAGKSEITITELAKLIIDMTNSKSGIVYVPYERAYGEGFEDLARRAADTTRLEATIGYRCSTKLPETLSRMIEFARATFPAG
jgi:UDP-glucose 4-epimerase